MTTPCKPSNSTILPMRLQSSLSLLFLLLLLLGGAYAQAPQSPSFSSGCEATATGGCYDKAKSLKLKVIAIFTILVASVIGIGLPLFSTALPVLHPDKTASVVVKVLASGVILSTGFMHVLPDSWNNLTSECLPRKPWRVFPMSTFIAMVTCVVTMMMDTVATAFFRKRGLRKRHSCHGGGGGGGGGGVHHVESPVAEGMEMGNPNEGDKVHGVHVVDGKEALLLRYRIIAQVLEMGIVVHSVVIGLSMGVSNNPCTITPLVAAMCFHQLFEGMGLGGCIIQAEYEWKMKATMVAFFSATTPFGIALGIGLQQVYNENSPIALVVVGILNALSSGLLIYMALVDLLAIEFMSPKLQGNIKLQFVCYTAAFIGMGVMSLMAKWA